MTTNANLALLVAQRELGLLLSVAFVDPFHHQRAARLEDPKFRRRTEQAAALLGREYSGIELGPGEQRLSSRLVRELFASFDEIGGGLRSTYQNIFGLTAISQQCPACEMEFEPNAEIFYRSQRLADVAGFYRAFGLKVSEQGKERLDHVSVEAEFLYVLLAKEAAALQNHQREGVEVCRQARGKFFQDHVGWWLPAFARLLSRVAAAGFYQNLARLAAAAAAVQRAELDLPLFSRRVVPRPSPGEPKAACFGCAAAS
ncbi:MAG: molecular chaperone [Acidobacteriota bacterium]